MIGTAISTVILSLIVFGILLPLLVYCHKVRNEIVRKDINEISLGNIPATNSRYRHNKEPGITIIVFEEQNSCYSNEYVPGVNESFVLHF